MRKNRLSMISCVVFFLFLVIVHTPAKGELIQEVPAGGTIDWGHMLIRCTGMGAGEPDSTAGDGKSVAIESARADALEKILITLNAGALTADRSVKGLLKGDADLTERVRRLAGKFREKGIHYMSDGSVEIEVELYLRGELVDLLLPPSEGGRRVADGLLCPTCGQPWPRNTDIPDDLEMKRPQGNPAEPYSGLVIDARGIGLQPALAPRVLNESGSVLYGIGFARRQKVLMAGLVSYEADLELAKAMSRVAPHPLVVEAIAAKGSEKVDVVIANEDGALLHCHPKHLQFMAECRVIIIVD
jgi:hypothetical protein